MRIEVLDDAKDMVDSFHFYEEQSPGLAELGSLGVCALAQESKPLYSPVMQAHRAETTLLLSLIAARVFRTKRSSGNYSHSEIQTIQKPIK